MQHRQFLIVPRKVARKFRTQRTNNRARKTTRISKHFCLQYKATVKQLDQIFFSDEFLDLSRFVEFALGMRGRMIRMMIPSRLFYLVNFQPLKDE